MSSNSSHSSVAIVGSGIESLLIGWLLVNQSQKQSNSDATTISIFSSEDDPHRKEESDDDEKKILTEREKTEDERFDDLGFYLYDQSTASDFVIFIINGLDLLNQSNIHTIAKSEVWTHTLLPHDLLSKIESQIEPEIKKFHQDLLGLLEHDSEDPRLHVKLGEFLLNTNANGYSNAFIHSYLHPILGIEEEKNLNMTKISMYEVLGMFLKKQILQSHGTDDVCYIIPMSSFRKALEDRLGSNLFYATPITDISLASSAEGSHELFTTSHSTVGKYQNIIFAPTPSESNVLSSTILKSDNSMAQILERMKEKSGDSRTVDIYYHSDPSFVSETTVDYTFSEACTSAILETRFSLKKDSNRRKIEGEAMEGGESGFGNKEVKSDLDEGSNKSFSVTFNLTNIINQDNDLPLFCSVDPVTSPEPTSILKHEQMVVQDSSVGSGINNTKMEQKGLWISLPRNIPAQKIKSGEYLFFGLDDVCSNAFAFLKESSPNFTPFSLASLIDTVSSSSYPSKIDVVDTARNDSSLSRLYYMLTYKIPVYICKHMILSFLDKAIKKGKGVLQLKLNDGSIISFGSPPEQDSQSYDKKPVVIRVFEDWFFVKTALEYDLGMARSYMAGHFIVEGLKSSKDYDETLLWPLHKAVETNNVIGDPIGLTRLFLLFIANRDDDDNIQSASQIVPSSQGHNIANALSNASGLFLGKLGSMFNYLRYKLTMDNSEKGGSLKNIHAHYDLSNDLFRTFLDKETLMYSSAIYDCVVPPNHISMSKDLMFKGSLEEAQWRKLDTLLARAQMTSTTQLTVLDIGFGWGGLSLRAAEKYNAKVHGITLSVEQMALAQERVKKQGLEHLITFEVVDYRTFSKKPENFRRFDRVLSCEMIEAVGHEHLGEFYESVERVLKRDGVLVMEAITTPEERYENYLR